MALPQPQMSFRGHDDGPPPPLWFRAKRWPVSYWIIVINVAIYVIDETTDFRLLQIGSFSVDAAVVHGQVWRFFTHAFLHASRWHLIGNMLALWSFGPTLELFLRRGPFVVYYLLNGLGGVAAYLLLFGLHALHVTADTQLVGASACIFGVIVGSARLSPNQILNLVWPPVRLRLKTLAWFAVGYAVLTIVTAGPNAGGETAHLGGAAVGFALVRNRKLFETLRVTKRRHRFWKPGDPASNFFRKDA